MHICNLHSHLDLKGACLLNPSSCSTYLGTSDEPSSERVILHDADRSFVAIEGDVTLAVQQAEDPHGTVLVTHGDMDAIGRGAEEGHLVFLALQDQDLDRKTRRRV